MRNLLLPKSFVNAKLAAHMGVICLMLLSGVGIQGQATTYTVCPTTSSSHPCDFVTLQAAIDAPAVVNGDVIELQDDLSEAATITISKSVTIDGLGFTLTSTSPGRGLQTTLPNVTVQNLTVKGAGTFGIHTNTGANGLKLINFTARENGRTGIALNCSNTLELTNVTSIDNGFDPAEGANGISITNCQNVTITDITTSGNNAPGFGAGIGIFNAPSFCQNSNTTGVVITGIVNISELPAFYQEASEAGAVVPDDTSFNPTGGSTLPNTHEVVFQGGSTLGFATLGEALGFAAISIALTAPPATSDQTRAITSVRNIATGDFIVRSEVMVPAQPPSLPIDVQDDLSIQAAINAAPATQTTISIGAGTYPEAINTTGKTVKLEVTNN